MSTLWVFIRANEYLKYIRVFGGETKKKFQYVWLKINALPCNIAKKDTFHKGVLT